MSQYLLNVFIYDNSQAHRHKLEKIIRDYAENNSIELVTMVSTAHPNKSLTLSLASSRLYFLNINDLEKKMDGIIFARNIRKNDLGGSIVFLTEHDIFSIGRSDLPLRSFRSHVTVMSFLAKDSADSIPFILATPPYISQIALGLYISSPAETVESHAENLSKKPCYHLCPLRDFYFLSQTQLSQGYFFASPYSLRQTENVNI